MLYDRLDAIDNEKTVDFVKNLQQSDGSFIGDKWGMLFHFRLLVNLVFHSLNLHTALNIIC